MASSAEQPRANPENPTVVALSAHVWRTVTVECGSALGARSYLVPAVAEDVVYANKACMHGRRRTFVVVYDYYHPALRSARTLTSRFSAVRRKRRQEEAAAMLVQTVVRRCLLHRTKNVLSKPEQEGISREATTSQATSRHRRNKFGK